MAAWRQEVDQNWCNHSFSKLLSNKPCEATLLRFCHMAVFCKENKSMADFEMLTIHCEQKIA